MYLRSELFFNSYDGAKLFMQKWSKDNSAGTILFTHGHGEHSDCYHRLISEFENSETTWNFIGWDLRGHGKSAGQRGYAKNFNEYVLDYDVFLNIVLNLPDVKDKPVILLAHSMGGLIQTAGLIEYKYPKTFPIIKAQVLSSPFFGLAFEVSKWKDASADLINNFFPKLTLNNELNNDQLSRDPAVIKEYELDTYRHSRMSPGVYIGFKQEFPKILNTASEINLPTYMHISDKDPVVSSEEALKVFDLLSSSVKGLKIVEGGRHELYNDSVRTEVIQEVIHFVNKYKK